MQDDDPCVNTVQILAGNKLAWKVGKLLFLNKGVKWAFKSLINKTLL